MIIRAPRRIADMTVVILLVFLAVVSNHAATIRHATIHRSIHGPRDLCDSKVYCDGELLKTVQSSGIFEDSKTFVDLSQFRDPDVTLSNFDALMKATNGSPNRTQVAVFVKENFSMQDELENTTLPDWVENPAMLKRISDSQFRKFAKSLNDVWKKLARKITRDVRVNPQRHSLIYVNNTFVVPGGRFKEFYYWDSYWIIEGLLLCEMHITVKGMIENFLSMVRTYGFVPNGGRVYYLSRSQPPMLIPMVAQYYKYTNDVKFLWANIATLDAEFEYWMNKKTVNVKKNGKIYRMAHYVVNSSGPRPESYIEDYQLVQQVPKEEQASLYNDLKAAAESGWDFSYRWCIATNNDSHLSLVNTTTSDIIPVDLNSILQRNARLLATFHRRLNNIKKFHHYSKIAKDYQIAIDEVLWNEEEGIWFDYDARNQRSRIAFYPSNLAPLYTLSYNQTRKTDYSSKALSYLKRNNIESYIGGTPTSLNYTGEQWDFPNAWPPLQAFLVQGLYNTDVKEAQDLARRYAQRWITANYIGYEKTGKMFEKYDATLPGKGGGGGEYLVQEGFGWTNGIVFKFLSLFPDLKSSDGTA